MIKPAILQLNIKLKNTYIETVQNRQTTIIKPIPKSLQHIVLTQAIILVDTFYAIKRY